MKVFIIAEAGVNHNGSMVTAKKMVDAASEAGADAVKFQTFIAKDVAAKCAPKAGYQKLTTARGESHLDMLKRLELDLGAHKRLMAHCAKRRIAFLSSPFDLKSIELLYSLGVQIFKIPSGEMTNLPYLRKVGSLNKRIIMSTGMADAKEIRSALNILIKAGTPKNKVILLHCNTEYPTPYEDANLSAMITLKDIFNMDIGYSDHTLGIEVAIAAAALGAVVIEKHFTLDRNMKGPDHNASLEPEELKQMVKAIRNVEKTLGNGIKRPSKSEIKNINIARKSIVAKRSIRKGDIFTEKNITTKRPGAGISPMKWDDVIGMNAKRDFAADELIEI